MVIRAFARLFVASVVFLAVMASQAAASVPPASFAELIESLSPAVVNISTSQKIKSNGMTFKFEGMPEGPAGKSFQDFFEQFGGQMGEEVPEVERDVTSLGSGFVIDPKGYIVTNNHVIAQADEITVTFQDDSQYDATIVGRDSKTDLALLKIESKSSLPYVEFGDSDKKRVGDWVIAIGNPFGLGGSVSAGIISARSRNINAGPFDDFIQTDAAINRGNSGGPLFDIDGRVIGVNSAIFSPSGGNVGIGFAIPSALAEPVLAQLREFGRTHRGWLGVKIQHVTEELAESLGMDKVQGALVLEVNADSPAEKSGIKNGDVIMAFNRQPIDEMRKLPRIVAETEIGKTVEVQIWRDEGVRTVRVTLGELAEDDEAKVSEMLAPKKAQDAPVKSETWMGAELAELTRSLRTQLGLPKDVSGVVVLKIKPDTAAFDARLQRGDVILEANRDAVSSVSDLQQAIEKAGESGKLHALLRINRKGILSYITIATKAK